MRIVDRKTFLGLPKGTVYAKYQPCAFDEVAIKDEPRGSNDWWVQDLTPWFGANNSDEYLHILQAMEKGEPSQPLYYDTVHSDGLYDEEQLFAVFEKRDVEDLIARLGKALADGYSDERLK